jgi:hypothetical protein
MAGDDPTPMPDNQAYYLNAPPLRGYVEGGGYAQASTLGYGGNPGLFEPPAATCSRNTHYFICRHETKCNCGLTERLPIELEEGL